MNRLVVLRQAGFLPIQARFEQKTLHWQGI